MSFRIIEGDCIEAMRGMDEASVDAVVCDPPYGLEFMGKEWDRLDCWRDGGGFSKPGIGDRATPWASYGGETANPSCRVCGGRARGAKKCGCDEPAWHVRGEDYRPGEADRARARRMQEWHEAWATEALRVLKPGGHLLAFGGTRTYHRLTCAIEDAGFEVRDCLAWLYGSGFPKSLDVSKAIDKRRDDEPEIREVCRFLRRSIEGSPESINLIAGRFGFHPRMVEHWAARDSDSQPTLPTLEQWDQLRDLLGFDDSRDAEVLRLNLRKGEPGEAWADRPVTGEVEEWANRSNYALTSRDGLRRDLPATPEAAQWQGWGTALKPAHEPIVLARKPLTGTVAGNVLAHGTGALNVDGCRVAMSDEDREVVNSRSGGQHEAEHWQGPGKAREVGERFTSAEGGRWPANVILDPEAAALLDEQSGTLTSGANPTRRRSDKFRTAYGDFEGESECIPARGADSGGASRFFYCAKASRAERNAGLEGLEEKPLGGQLGQRDGKRMGRSANEGANVRESIGRNVHPTVKPIALMRWLVRLVTPPGGTILDPFTGSGTTGAAAVLEGFDFIGIEREAEYVEIAEARIAHWAAQPKQLTFGEAA